MPVASNPLLQSSVVANSARPQNSAQDKATQAFNDKGLDFSRVYSQQSRDQVGNKADAPVREDDGVEKTAANSGKSDGPGHGKVADSGNKLPDDREVPAKAEAQGDDDSDVADADPQSSLDASLVAGQLTDAP